MSATVGWKRSSNEGGVGASDSMLDVRALFFLVLVVTLGLLRISPRPLDCSARGSDGLTRSGV